MQALDEWIVGLGGGHRLVVLLLVAVLLGLRHATDPDHLAAVSMLIANDREDGSRRAARLGLAWGLGHASTLVLFGIPIILFKSYIPATAQDAAEAAVGLLIIALAIRLLHNWRSGSFHSHRHRHGAVEHRHLHSHRASPRGAHGLQHSHSHATEHRLGRSATQAYAIGLVHGTGGSAGVGVLLIAGIPGHGPAAAALVLFALGAAASMSALSCGFGYALTREPVSIRALPMTPVMGVATLLFGVWYALAAVVPVL